MKPKLRPYQDSAVEDTYARWAASATPALGQAATGLGKTVMLARIAEINASVGLRTLILVHRDELVRQTVDKLQAADPAMRIGIVQGANMGVFADAVVASVQTLIRRLAKISPTQFPRIIVDECHHAPAKSYMDILRHFGALDPNSSTRTLGVTATPARGDGQGLGGIFDPRLVFEYGIPFGVEGGFLVPAEVRTLALDGLNTDQVKTSQGDLQAGDLGRAMSGVHAGEKIAEAYARYGQDAYGEYRRAVSFAPTIEVAEAWCGDYERAGARPALITGSTPTHERQAAYRDVANGHKDVLSSVMVLTEGFDLPAVEVAIVGRPTKSMPLLTQMIGRVLRPSPGTGKEAALILDVVGSLGRGLARSFDLSIPGPEKPVAPEQDPDGEPRQPMEKITLKPPPRVEFVAYDLLGRGIKAPKLKATHMEPVWLRTYGGVPFLPATPDYPWRILCAVIPGGESPWWRKAKDEPLEPLTLAEGTDVRTLHPGTPRAWEDMPPTEPQGKLLTRLGLGEATTKAAASNLIEIHFASRELDRLVRPKMKPSGPVAPPPGCSP